MQDHQKSAEETRSLDDRAWDLWGELLLQQEVQRLQAEAEAEHGTLQGAVRDAFFAQQAAQHLGIIDRELRRGKRQRFAHHTLPRLVRAAAIVLAVLTLAGGVALAASPALRVQVMKLLAISTPEYTELRLVPDEEASFEVPADWKGQSFLSYVPEGLVLGEAYTMGSISYAQYRDAHTGEVRLNFTETGPTAESNIDTEHALITQVTVGPYPASLIRKNENCMVYWSDGHELFILETRYLSQEETLRTAQGVVRLVR